MSLTQALGIALTGLRVNQQQLAVLSHNIANANTPGYSRQVVDQSALYAGNALQGVKVEDIVRKSDIYLQRTVRTQLSQTGLTDVRQAYYDRTQILFGQPGASNSLDSYTEQFFADMKALADTPDRSSIKYTAVNSGVRLADELSALAAGLEDLRYQADQDIDKGVDQVNQALRNLYNINIAINNADALGTSTAGLLDERDKALSTVSEHMDILTYFKEDGQVQVSTSAGIALLDQDLHQLSYSPSPSAQTFVNNGTLRSIDVTATDINGNAIGNPITMVSAGTSGISGSPTTIKSTLKTGKLQGLIQMRDTDIPNMVSQLDEFASTLRDALNAIHNDGAGFPAAESLTGQRAVLATDENDWQGVVRIGVLDSDGTPAPVPQIGGTQPGMLPLTLDLGSLDTGNGAGRPSVQGIIDEINWAFGPPQNSATVGALSDFRVAALSDSMTAGAGTFSFNLEMLNTNQNNVTMNVTNVAITGGATVTVPAAFPSNNFTVPAGNMIRSGTTAGGGISVTLDMTTAAAGPYTLSVDVAVTDPLTGAVTNSTLTYTLNNAASGLLNDRYFVNAVGAGGTMNLPSTSQAYLQASLVKADGTPAVAGEQGYLKLETLGKDAQLNPFVLAIDEMDSKELGNSSVSPAITATNRGFSHYFGLNNFFDDTRVTTPLANSALYLNVRDDIVDNPNLISTGSLVQSRQPTNPGLSNYTYELGSGGNDIAQAMVNLGASLQAFDSAGTLPSVTLTFANYVGEIIGFNANQTASAQATNTQQQLLLSGYQERSDAVTGVNLDEELANTVIYQNAYAASAKVITVTDELFATLLGSFGR